MMKIRKRRVILGVIVLAVLSAGGWYWYRTTTDEYKARQLVAELREYHRVTDESYSGPGTIKQWLMDQGLMKPKWPRESDKIIEDLVALGKSAVPALIEVLKDENSDMRCNAAWALGEIGPAAKESVPALIRLLESEFVDEGSDVWFDDDGDSWSSAEEARRRAAEALGRIGLPAKTAVPALIKVLKDEDNMAQEEAAWALGMMGPVAKDAIPALIQALKDEDSDVRRYAAEALGQIAPAVAVKEAVPVLVKDLEDKDAGERFWAAVALVNIAPAATAEKTVPILIQGLKDEDLYECEWVDAAEVLGKIGPAAKDAIPVLHELLKDEDEDVRYAAAEALKQIEAKAEAE